MKSDPVTESSILELIEMANGDVALRQANSNAAPLLSITFSKESMQSMQSMKMHVARAMIEAGIEAFAELNSALHLMAVDTKKVVH